MRSQVRFDRTLKATHPTDSLGVNPLVLKTVTHLEFPSSTRTSFPAITGTQRREFSIEFCLSEEWPQEPKLLHQVRESGC
jgi:hypothetical protein